VRLVRSHRPANVRQLRADVVPERAVSLSLTIATVGGVIVRVPSAVALTIWPARVGGDAVRVGVWLGGVNGLTCDHNTDAINSLPAEPNARLREPSALTAAALAAAICLPLLDAAALGDTEECS
jgi:hypothetical protein